MTNSITAAEARVQRLITSANQSHAGARWSYEITSEVDNIEVASGHEPGAHTLRIHPCWLRYVMAQGEFKSCVADEIEAWHVVEALTAEESYPVVA